MLVSLRTYRLKILWFYINFFFCKLFNWTSIEHFHSVLWDSYDKGRDHHAGVPNKRSWLKFFCYGTPIWQL